MRMLRTRPKLTDLGLPLRDLLRGAMVLEAGSRSLLEPATAHLPAPLRGMLGRVGAALRDVEASAARAERPSLAEIRRAAGDLSSQPTRPADPAVFGRVLAFGLSSALPATGAGHLMASETVAAYVFTRQARRAARSDGSGMAAARIAIDLDQHHVAGAAPGTNVALGQDDRERARVAIVAVMLWLLAERGEEGADEERLLALAVAVARSMQAELLAAFGDAEALAAALSSSARMI